MKFKTLSNQRKLESVGHIPGATHELSHLIETLLDWSVSQRKGIKANPARLAPIGSINTNIKQHRLETEIKLC